MYDHRNELNEKIIRRKCHDSVQQTSIRTDDSTVRFGLILKLWFCGVVTRLFCGLTPSPLSFSLMRQVDSGPRNSWLSHCGARRPPMSIGQHFASTLYCARVLGIVWYSDVGQLFTFQLRRSISKRESRSPRYGRFERVKIGRETITSRWLCYNLNRMRTTIRAVLSLSLSDCRHELFAKCLFNTSEIFPVKCKKEAMIVIWNECRYNSILRFYHFVYKF